MGNSPCATGGCRKFPTLLVTEIVESFACCCCCCCCDYVYHQRSFSVVLLLRGSFSKGKIWGDVQFRVGCYRALRVNLTHTHTRTHARAYHPRFHGDSRGRMYYIFIEAALPPSNERQQLWSYRYEREILLAGGTVTVFHNDDDDGDTFQLFRNDQNHGERACRKSAI